MIHIPQTEKVYTVYEQDTPYKLPDVYAYQWQSYEKKTVLDISDRVGSPSLSDDSDSVCLELTFQVLQATGEKYFKPLEIRPGRLCLRGKHQQQGMRLHRAGTGGEWVLSGIPLCHLP